MTSRRQHTIPQFYLRGFLEPGYVYRRGASEPRCVNNARDVAVRQDFYGKRKDGKQTLDDINSKIEEDGALSFKKLVENPFTFMEYDWKMISYVLANIFVRTPGTIEAMNDALLSLADQVSSDAARMKEKLTEDIEAGSDLSDYPTMFLDDEEAPSMPVEQMAEDAARMRAEGGHRITAAITFSSTLDVAKCIQQMRFLILEAPQAHFFITSDLPLVLRSRLTGSSRGIGWANPDVQAAIPLHPTKYLFMYYGDSPGIEQHQASVELVNDLNSATMIFAREEIYSPIKHAEAESWMKG